MTARRRYNNRHNNGSVFNAGTVVNVLTIPLLTGAISLIGFYFLANYRINQNTDDIKTETAAREKVSNQFFDKLGKLNDSINVLSTNVAVQAEQNKQIAASLAQISNQLSPHLGPH